MAAVGGGSGADAWQLVGPVTCETDRARFLGRARGVRRPAMLDDAADGPLPGTTGAVLDPVFVLRARVRIEPSQSAKVAFTTLVAPDRDRAIELADRYHDPYSAQRALDLSWMQAQVEMRELRHHPGRCRAVPGNRGLPALADAGCARAAKGHANGAAWPGCVVGARHFR